MRRIGVLIILVIGIGSTLFGGCAQPKQGAQQIQTTEEQRASRESMTVTILGGSPGGEWSAVAEGFGEAIRRGCPGAQVTVQPGKDGPNAVRVSSREVDLAISNAVTAYLAYHGREPYDSAYSNLRVVARTNPRSSFHFLIKDIGINTIEELKQKKYPLRISMNAKGSTFEVAGRFVLNAYGISYQDIERWGGKVHFLNFKEAFELMDNGQLDAVTGFPPYPASYFVEASLKHKLKLLPLNQEVMAQASEKLGTRPGEIPAGAYSFQKEAIPTIMSGDIFITAAEQPEDKIYTIVKALYTNFDYFKSVHASMQDLKPEDLPKGINIPLHQGAERFYKEMGYIQ